MSRGRLRPEFLERSELFCDRCVALAEQLERDGRFRRIVEQLAASGSAVGANLAEADQGMSVKDFRKCLSIAIKELAETGFWLRLVVRRGWVPVARVGPLQEELDELRRVIGSILHRTARRDGSVTSSPDEPRTRPDQASATTANVPSRVRP